MTLRSTEGPYLVLCVELEDKHALSLVSIKMYYQSVSNKVMNEHIQVLSTLSLTPLSQCLPTSEGCLQPASVHGSLSLQSTAGMSQLPGPQAYHYAFIADFSLIVHTKLCTLNCAH